MPRWMRKAEVIFCSSFSFDTMQQCDLRILDAVRARDSSLVTHGTSHQPAAAAAAAVELLCVQCMHTHPYAVSARENELNTFFINSVLVTRCSRTLLCPALRTTERRAQSFGICLAVWSDSVRRAVRQRIVTVLQHADSRRSVNSARRSVSRRWTVGRTKSRWAYCVEHRPPTAIFNYPLSA